MQIVSRKLIRDILGIHPDDGPASKEALVFVMWLRLFFGTIFAYGPTTLVWYYGGEIIAGYDSEPAFEI